MFTGIMINDALQRSVATWFRCGGSFDHYFTINLLLSLFWKKIKIAQHLAKLWGKSWLPQARCAEKWGTRSRSDLWRTRTVGQHRITIRL